MNCPYSGFHTSIQHRPGSDRPEVFVAMRTLFGAATGADRQLLGGSFTRSKILGRSCAYGVNLGILAK